MPRLMCFYGLNDLHFVTTSTYRRARLFDSERFKRKFTTSLAELRREYGFKLCFRLIGYVLIPEHCHLLLWTPELAPKSPFSFSPDSCLLCPVSSGGFTSCRTARFSL